MRRRQFLPHSSWGNTLPDEASSKGRHRVALHVLAYNLTRVMNIVAFSRRWPSSFISRYSCAAPFGPAILVTQGPSRPFEDPTIVSRPPDNRRLPKPPRRRDTKIRSDSRVQRVRARDCVRATARRSTKTLSGAATFDHSVADPTSSSAPGALGHPEDR